MRKNVEGEFDGETDDETPIVLIYQTEAMFNFVRSWRAGPLGRKAAAYDSSAYRLIQLPATVSDTNRE